MDLDMVCQLPGCILKIINYEVLLVAVSHLFDVLNHFCSAQYPTCKVRGLDSFLSRFRFREQGTDHELYAMPSLSDQL